MPGTQLSWERAELPGDRVSSEMREKYLDTYKQYKQEGESREGASSCSSMSSLGAHRGRMWVSTGVEIPFSLLRKLSEGSGSFLHLIGGTSGESSGHKMTGYQVRVGKSVFMASSLPQ